MKERNQNSHSKMVEAILTLAFLPMFVCPLVILAMSMANLFFDFSWSNSLSEITRDCAQVMYFCITCLGLLNQSTGITWRWGFVTFGMIQVGAVAICCLFMSLNGFKTFISPYLLAIDLIANSAAFVYLFLVWTKWYMNRKKKGERHMV